MAITYRLEHTDGTPADPPTIRSAAGVTWRPGDTMPLGPERVLHITEIKPATHAEEYPVLVVEAD
jgi:hypothetical protein